MYFDTNLKIIDFAVKIIFQFLINNLFVHDK